MITAEFRSALLGDAGSDPQIDRLLEILDLLPNMLWVVSDDGKTRYYSRQWQEFTGTRIVSSEANAQPSLIHPDDRERAAAAVDEARASGRYECEYRLRHHSGEYRWVLSLGKPERDAAGKIVNWYGTCTEIDELKRIRDDFNSAAGLNRSIVDSSTDRMILLDMDGTILFLNDASQEEMGRERAAGSIGRNWLDVFPWDNPARLEAWHQVAKGERVSFTGPYDGTTGGQKWWDIQLSPVREVGGEIIRILVVARDITHTRSIEARLKELQNELIHVSRVSAMGTMASMLAHELNQPLTAISSYIAGSRRLLDSDTSDPALLHEALDQAERNAQRAGKIIRRVREMVKGGPSHRKLVKVATIVTEALELASIGSNSQDVAIRMDVDAALTIEADAVQLQQVMLNLIRNAFEALDGCARREVTISARRERDHVEIEVTDTGPGIAAEVIDRLFDAFATSKSDGLGIGLSICRTIIEAHDGSISAAHGPEGGARFTVRIPIVAREHAAAA